MHMYGGSIEKLTEPKDEIRKMELVFRNERVINSKGETESVDKPLMNEKGINVVKGQVQAIVNQITIMGNITNNEVNAHMLDFADVLIQDLMLNKVKYGITNPSARNIILSLSIRLAHVCATRGREGDDKRFWKGSQHEVTMRNEQAQQNSGLFSKVTGWGQK